VNREREKEGVIVCQRERERGAVLEYGQTIIATIAELFIHQKTTLGRLNIELYSILTKNLNISLKTYS